MITKSILKKICVPRSKETHKGDFGRLLVIGGSEIYTGAPVLVALAAYRAGVDLVALAAPQRVADVAAKFLPDIITVPLRGADIKVTHLKILLNLAEKSDAVVIGNGLGKNKTTMKVVALFLKKTKKPAVIDADAIYAVAKYQIKPKIKNNFILTPHLGEFFALTGKKPKTPEDKKIEILKAAKKYDSVILLKGHVDLISDGVKLALNKTGNPFMTKGGTGDVLAGVCGSFLAQGRSAFLAACAAAYVTGKAGDLVARKKKQALLASEVADAVGEVLKNF